MTSEARVFVVHVWADAEAFHARARAADAEQATEFVDPQRLLAFLRGETGAPPAPEAAPSQQPTL